MTSICHNCGDHFDAPERECPDPSPGIPYVDCGRGGHYFIDSPEALQSGTLRAAPMSEVPINLSNLKAARAAMTPGEYRFDRVHGTIDSDRVVIVAPQGGPTPYISKTICELYIANMVPNAIGIVATHNAVDALIEVVEAALERAARMDPRDDRNRTDAGLDAALAADRRFRAALANVQLAKAAAPARWRCPQCQLLYGAGSDSEVAHRVRGLQRCIGCTEQAR